MLNTIQVIQGEWNYGPVDIDEQGYSTWSLLISTENGGTCFIDANLPGWLSYPNDNSEDGYKNMQDYIVGKYWKGVFGLGINIKNNPILKYNGSKQNGLIVESTISDIQSYGLLLVENIFKKYTAQGNAEYYILYDNIELKIYDNSGEQNGKLEEILSNMVTYGGRCMINNIPLGNRDEDLILGEIVNQYPYSQALNISGILTERIND